MDPECYKSYQAPLSVVFLLELDVIDKGLSRALEVGVGVGGYRQ